MKTMDRYLITHFFTSYLICFLSMVGLYVIIDLFANADEFIEDHAGTLAFFRRADTYYLFHSFEYFGRLSPIITQVAAMTTLAALHRHNEIVALLAAGVPTRRALMPIFAGVLFMNALGVANREVFIPRNSEILQRAHEDIEATQALIPAVHIDSDQVLFRAGMAHREGLRLQHVYVTLPLEIVGQLQEVQSKEAFYRIDEQTGRGGWLLENPSPIQILRKNDKVKVLPNGDLFIFTDVTFSDMIRRHNWMDYASTGELLEQLQKERLVKNPQQVRILIHRRFMQPVLGVLLVLIGVPFVLQWERKNIYRSIFVSMILSALFFMTDGIASYFAEHGYVDPLSAAWIPVFLFGPISLALLHRIGS